MNHEPLQISVLIPAYNAERYLGEALECVRRQTLAPYEVVVVDDGSTDGTAALVEGLGQGIRYHRQENQGICGARNACLERARGNTMAFLDSDDLWPDDSLELRAGVLNDDPSLDGVVGMVEQFLCPDIPPELKDQYVIPPGTRVGRLAGSMLLRRRAFDMAGVFDPDFKMGDTMDWALRADAEGVKLASLEKLVLRRRIHGENFMVHNQGDQSSFLRILKANLDRRRAQP